MDDQAHVMSDADYERARVRVEELASSGSSPAGAAELAGVLRAMRAWEQVKDRADAIGARPAGLRLQ